MNSVRIDRCLFLELILYLGFKIGSHTLYLHGNSTIGILDDAEVSLASDWSVQYGDVVLSNAVVNSRYEITVKTSDIALTFIRKLYRHSGVQGKKTVFVHKLIF